MKAEVDVNVVAVSAVMQFLRELGVRWWHNLNCCSCDQGYFLPGIPCEIGRQEIEEKKARVFFSRWDALGLGYIGPGR